MKRKSSPLRLKSVTTATIHSLRSDREDLHVITIRIRFFLKTISFETQEIVTNLLCTPSPHHRQHFFTGCQNPASNFDLWRSTVTKKQIRLKTDFWIDFLGLRDPSNRKSIITWFLCARSFSADSELSSSSWAKAAVVWPDRVDVGLLFPRRWTV